VSKEPNANFQDPEEFLVDPNHHDLMRIRPRTPNTQEAGPFMPLYGLGLRAPHMVKTDQ
jgi:hypothetical protein